MSDQIKKPAENSAGSVRQLPPETVTVKLDYPVKHASEDGPITKLVLRRPKAKDLRDVPASPKVGDLLNVAARLSGHPASVIDMLEVPDWNKVAEVVGNFLQGGQTTGETSSES